jgi:hypothetical protein
MPGNRQSKPFTSEYRTTHYSEVARANDPQRSSSPPVDAAGAAEKSGTRNGKALDGTRTALKGVAAASPLIPMVGQYIKCAADVGRTAIDMFQVALYLVREFALMYHTLQGMNDNTDKGKKLCDRVLQVSGTILAFQNDPSDISLDTMGYLQASLR